MLKRVAIGFAATSALLVLTLSAMQDAIIYHPRTYSSFGAFQYYENIKLKFKQQTGQTIEPFEYEDAMNGGTQTSYFIPARQQTMTDLWIVFGGNAQLALDWVEFITTVRTKHPSLDSHAFVLFDYPGYGQSMGKVNETSLRWSIKAAIQRVMKQSDAAKINLLAHSIGCAAALNFAVHEPINGGLVLISPFVSIPQMALDILVPFGSKNSFALTIANYLVRAENQWDNMQRIRDLAGDSNNKRQTLPLVIVHGDRDNIVPVEHGRMLYTETKRFPLFRTMQYIEIKRGDHNSIVYVSADTIIEDGMKQICSKMYVCFCSARKFNRPEKIQTFPSHKTQIPTSHGAIVEHANQGEEDSSKGQKLPALPSRSLLCVQKQGREPNLQDLQVQSVHGLHT